MKLSELQQAYANPNVRKYLDFIASSEGVKHGYNTIFGNERFNNLGAHPNVRKEFTQTDGRKNYTTAAGRYQFLNGTWGNLQKQYGFRDFSPQSQDLGAIALIAQRGALNDVMNGNWNGATGKLGKEWASLPSSQYKQGKRSQDFANKFFGAQPQPQGLTVQQLTAKYGKPKPVDFGGSSQQAQQPQGLTVQALTAKYGQPKAVDFGSMNPTQKPEPSGQTVQELTAKYGSPKQVNLSAFGGNT